MPDYLFKVKVNLNFLIKGLESISSLTGREVQMDRQTVIEFLQGEIKGTEGKLKKLAAQKADTDNPRTAWHSQFHLDQERNIADLERYKDRCTGVLAALRSNKANGYVHEGSIVSLSIDGEENDYIIVREGGAAIGRYSVISVQSPIGKAIWNRRVGETVSAKTPAGVISITINSVA